MAIDQSGQNQLAGVIDASRLPAVARPGRSRRSSRRAPRRSRRCMMASVVTTSPMITRSNGADTIYMYPVAEGVCLPVQCGPSLRTADRSDAIGQRERSKRMILHDVRVHPSKDEPAARGPACLEDRRRRRRQGAVEQGRRRDDRQPHHRQRLRGDRARSTAIRWFPRATWRSVIRARTARRCSASPPGKRVSPEWAAWANGTAVRELDMHDTFLAADYSHPGDNIPPILAVAQTMGKSGRDLIRGIATGYEIQIDLVRAICLHEHKIDHIAHLCPAQAAGIGTLLGLKQEVDLPGGAAGGACQLHHAPVAQGRDQLVEGLRAGACRQAGGRGGGSRACAAKARRARSTKARTA